MKNTLTAAALRDDGFWIKKKNNKALAFIVMKE